MSDENKVKSLSDVIEKPVEETEGASITLGDILDSYGNRSYGPLLVIIAIIAMLPIIGGIPGMSIVTGLLVIVLSAQLLFSLEHPWLPKKLLSVSFGRRKLTKGVDRARPWAKWIGKVVGSRLTILLEPPLTQIIAVLCIGLGILFIPMALLPFAVLAPAAGVMLFGLALTAQDGVLALIGFVASCFAVGFTMYIWPNVMDALHTVLGWVGLG